MTLAGALFLVGALDLALALAAWDKGDQWYSGFLTGLGFVCVCVAMIAAGFTLTNH